MKVPQGSGILDFGFVVYGLGVTVRACSGLGFSLGFN